MQFSMHVHNCARQLAAAVWQLLPIMLHEQAEGVVTQISASDAKYALVAIRRTMLAGTAAMVAHSNTSCAACLLPAVSLASLLALLKLQYKQTSLRRLSGRFITNGSQTFKMRRAFCLFDVGSSSIQALCSSSMYLYNMCCSKRQRYC